MRRSFILFITLIFFSLLANGRAQSYNRIICMVPSLTEIIFELHAGPLLIGISDYAKYPDSTRMIEKVGGLYNINPEKIVRMNPDLIIVDHSKVFEEKLSQLGMIHPDIISLKTETIHDILHNIDSLGTILNKNQQAQKLLRQLKAILKEKNVAIRGRGILVVSRTAGSFTQVYVAGQQTFINELAELSGIQNVVREAGYVQINPEYILRQKPDYILEFRAQSSHNQIPELKGVWEKFLRTANFKPRVYILTEDYYIIPGPRIGKAIQNLRKVLDGD